MGIYSSVDQVSRIASIISSYICLPVSTNVIPGAFLEAVLAHVRTAVRLNTYDYVDVYLPATQVGWSIKSTKSATPVTWKRAKIPNQIELITESRKSKKGQQALGDAIIDFCNAHVRASMIRYNLIEIGYARLIVFPNGLVRYFERKLCDQHNPDIFDAADFEWRWSSPKQAKKKEQLSALHGRRWDNGVKWWAWHGLGENQLHFNGEKSWWPPPDDSHAISFNMPSEDRKLSFDRLVDILDNL
jgi:hypothetical protein